MVNRTVDDVEQLKCDVRILRVANEELRTQYIRAKDRAAALEEQNAHLQDKCDRLLERSERMRTIISQVTEGLVSSLNLMNEERADVEPKRRVDWSRILPPHRVRPVREREPVRQHGALTYRDTRMPDNGGFSEYEPAPPVFLAPPPDDEASLRAIADNMRSR